MRPQEWIVTALDGFFASEGQTMPEQLKGALAGRMVLACAGIQGEIDIGPFLRLLSDCDAQPVDNAGGGASS